MEMCFVSPDSVGMMEVDSMTGALCRKGYLMLPACLLLCAASLCAEPSTAELNAALEAAKAIRCNLMSSGEAPQVFTLKSVAEVAEFVELIDLSDRAKEFSAKSRAATFWHIQIETKEGKTVDFLLIGDTQVFFGPGGKWITSLRSGRAYEWLTKKATPPPPPPMALQARMFKVYDNQLSTGDVKSLGRHQIVIGKDQNELFVSEDGTNSLSFYNRSPRGGIVRRYQVFQDQLTPHKLAGAKLIGGLTPPLSLALSDSGNLLYVLSAKSNSIVCFQRNLRVGGWQPDLPVGGVDGIEGLREPQAFVAGDGDGIHVITRAGLLLTLRRDESTKKMAVASRVNLGNELPADTIAAREADWDLAVDPKGSQIYAICSAGLLVVVNRDKDDKWNVAQVLRDTMPDDRKSRGLIDATSIAVQAAGARLFVVSSRGTVGVWSRNQDSGELSFDRVFAHEQLLGAVQVSVSRLEERLLVVSEQGNAVFEVVRRPEGEISLLRSYVFDGPTAAAASADDRSVYVGSDKYTLSVLVLIHDDALPGLP